MEQIHRLLNEFLNSWDPRMGHTIMRPWIYITRVHMYTLVTLQSHPYTTRVGIPVELVFKQLKASTTAVKNRKHHHVSMSIIAVKEIDRDPAPL